MRRLDGASPTTVRTYKLPLALASAFAERCAELGWGQSHQLRVMIERWLRQTAEIKRLKEKSS